MTHPLRAIQRAIQPEVPSDPQFPLGAPLNRKPPGLRPIAGRPNWFRDAHDLPYYVEPGVDHPPAATNPPGPL